MVVFAVVVPELVTRSVVFAAARLYPVSATGVSVCHCGPVAVPNPPPRADHACDVWVAVVPVSGSVQLPPSLTPRHMTAAAPPDFTNTFPSDWFVFAF